MPEIGEIKRIQDGKKVNLIFVECPRCKSQRWMQKSHYERQKVKGACIHCVFHLYPNHYQLKGSARKDWKGGITYNQGYKLIRLYKDDFFYSMAGRNQYVREHCLVMAKHLGRCLQKGELVHHKNGIRDDNRIENLELSSREAHIINHSKGYRDGYNKGLRDGQNKQIEELRKEIKLLQWQIKEGQQYGNIAKV